MKISPSVALNLTIHLSVYLMRKCTDYDKGNAAQLAAFPQFHCFKLALSEFISLYIYLKFLSIK